MKAHRRFRWVAFFILLICIADPSLLYADDSVRLMVGRSTVVSVGSPIARVSLTTPEVADALVTSPTELLINGKTPGTISMFVWDRVGAIKRYEVVVQRDLARLSEQLQQLFPNEKIEARSNGKDIVLAGSVSGKDVVEKAINLAAGYVDKKDEIVSLLQVIEGPRSNQVLLRVRFAEVSRTALTELGAGFFTSATGVKNVLGRVTTDQVAAPTFSNFTATKASSDFNAPVTSASGNLSVSDFLNLFLFSERLDLGLVIRALQQRGLFQSLAEPNLVAESGKEASFLAGGEFPIPIAQGGSGVLAVTVMFKEFGVRLNFTPVVTGDRVHLKVRPEVSTLDFANAVQLQGFRIPALSTRRTETELELADGQTFAIAGLLNNSMTQTLQKVPGIGDIPILGELFRSKAAQKDRTELVVMITPHILPTNSPGVTPALPRLQEPFLPPLNQKKSLEPQPPAFGARPGGTAQAAPPAQAAPAAAQIAPMTAVVPPATRMAPAPAPAPAAAAATVQALTPNSRPVVNGDTLPATPIEPAPAARPLTAKDQAASDTARPQSAALTRQQQSDAKRALEGARKNQHAEQAAQDAAARRNAEAAKKQAELEKKQAELAKKQSELDEKNARKQAEVDKKNQRAIAEAEAKVKAAQAALDAETAKAKKQQ